MILDYRIYLRRTGFSAAILIPIWIIMLRRVVKE
jgi:hypothetical protein